MASDQQLSNAPEMSVSDLSHELKRTLEDAYGYVRVRGELSRVKVHSSGHMYTDLKDDQSVLNAVCWRGTMSRLSIKPEEGLDVICTGRISTYPARSNYQLIIESMELAGEGALLKMLEERRKRLAAEGLFDAGRKQPLPFLPKVIGVVTSPTGAVIRDIMHRLNDRFPRHVLLWPVNVQGENAAKEIAAAINGFSKMKSGGSTPRPDLLIVARGGGSLEDLMAFNEENVVRAAADCTIPLISAVGHETDTTLIDYAADVRAPTPTGAAEMAVPKRINLMAQVKDDEQRLLSAISRVLSDKKTILSAHSVRLSHPERLLEAKSQKLDYLNHKITSTFERSLESRKSRISTLGARLLHPRARLEEAGRIVSYHGERLTVAGRKLLEKPQQKLEYASRMLESMSFKNVLNRGFVIVRDENGAPITDANDTKVTQTVRLHFKDDKLVDAVIGRKPGDKKKSGSPKADQGQLF